MNRDSTYVSFESIDSDIMLSLTSSPCLSSEYGSSSKGMFLVLYFAVVE